MNKHMCGVELELIFLEATLHLRSGQFLKRSGRVFQDDVPGELSLLTLFGGGLRLRKYRDTNKPSFPSGSRVDEQCCSGQLLSSLCKKLFSHCPLLSLWIVNTSDFPGLAWWDFQFQEMIVRGKDNEHMFNVLYILFLQLLPTYN